ncbi:MAG: hypothetical protein IT318_04280, partial [Anaerolineales bacterium]|nr:hypothetical protein [Anaerolineales bacterium]
SGSFAPPSLLPATTACWPFAPPAGACSRSNSGPPRARRFADQLQAAGCPIRDEVVANQALVAFGDAAATQRAVTGIQAEGACRCGGTVGQCQTAMRISVSSWATTEACFTY